MDIDRAYISKIVLEGGIEDALDSGVESSLFTEEGAELWDWCRSHFREFGKAPGEEAFTQQFPAYSLLRDASEPAEYYAGQLRYRFTHNTLTDAVKSALDVLKLRTKPMEALALFKNAIRTVDSLASDTKVIDFVESAEVRWGKYTKAKECGGVDGIPFMFPGMTAATLGKHPEDLIFYVARMKVGKTWALALEAQNDFAEHNKNVLFFTNEMAVHQIGRRIDAKDADLPYQALRAGEMDTISEERWRARMEANRDKKNFFKIISGATKGIANIAAHIERFKPDVVYIDGGYMIQDERGGESNWLRQQNIAEDLKRLAQTTGVPILVSLQLNRQMETAMADIDRWADAVIMLDRTEDEKLSNLMQYVLRLQREGSTGGWLLQWDIDGMQFRQLSATDEDAPVQEEGVSDGRVAY